MRKHTPGQDGFILITVLLTMVLLAAIGTTLLLKSTSEIRQVGNAQGQAQARADAEGGQADMFAQLANPGIGIMNTVIRPYSDAFANSNGNAATTPIIPESAFPSVLTSLQARFPNITTTVGTGVSAHSSTSAITFRTMRTDTGGYTRTGNSQVQPYYIDYAITATGSQNLNKRIVTTEGTMKILLGRLPLNLFVLLANDGGSGSTGTSGFFDSSTSYDGPVQVNQNLALSGTPTFAAGLSVASPSIWMNSSCGRFTFVRVVGQQSQGCTVPNTGGNGIQYNTDPVPLPTNAASQQRAALGLDPNLLTAVSNTEICTALNPAATPCSTVTNGVFVPIRGGRPSGGIYVQGNGQVTMSTSNGKQVYTVTDASNRVTVVTVDYTAQTTTVRPPTGATSVYPGLPNGQLYVSGNLTSLGGPARTGTLPNPAPSSSVPGVVPPAVASASQLNIAAGGAVTITGDLTYTDDPRLPGSTAQNVLGIISGTQDVDIGTAAPNDIYIQAAILAGASGTGLGVTNYNQGGPRGAIHLLGSLAEESDQLRYTVNGSGVVGSGYVDDLHFDRRFTNGGVSPPFFPTTTRFAVQTGFPIQRTWAEQ